MSHDTLEIFLAEIFGYPIQCPNHAKPREKSDSEASEKLTRVEYKLESEQEENKPQITLSFEKQPDGDVSIAGHDGKMKKTILFFNSNGKILLCKNAKLDGLQTGENGCVKIQNEEDMVESPSETAEPKHPSVNGVEIWTEKDSDGDVQIRGKNKQGMAALIAWVGKNGKLKRSMSCCLLAGIATDACGKIEVVN